jgi:ubiquinone/menaquinone biosynthesis C-methylase UbiE
VGRSSLTLYDRLGSWYDLLAGAGEARLSQLGLAMAGIMPGERVLELGCGTGLILRQLAAHTGPAGLVAGIDISTRMSRAAQSRMRKEEDDHPPFVVQGDVLNLPFQCESMDVVFAAFVIELLPDGRIPRLLQETKRIMRPRGRLCSVSLSQRPTDSWMTALYSRLHKVFPGILDCHPIRLKEILLACDFVIDRIIETNIWGLNVDIILSNTSKG